MPGDRPERGRPPHQPVSWRGERKQAARGPREYEFRGAKEEELRRRRFRRRMRASAFTAAAILLVAAWIYWVWRIPVRTPVLVLTLTNYPAPIPPNAWAQEDARHWPTAASDSNLLGSTVRAGSGGAADVEALLAAVRRARPGGPNKDVVLVYVSAHGVVNSEGEPCLLLPPAAGRPAGELWHLDEKRWLPVRRLLADLSAHRPTPRWNWFRPARETKLVLFLDAHRLANCWPLGLATNPFAAALRRTVAELVEARKTPGVYVVAAADEGEAALTSARHGRSAFAAYVQLGLQGAAAQQRHVTLLGLQNYLRSAVDAWAITARASHQRPVLLPAIRTDRDFPLAHAATPPPDPQADRPPKPAVPWEDVNALWDFLANHQPWLENPRGLATRGRWLQWVHLRNQLLRLEQLNQAGQAYRQEAIDLLATCSTLRQKMQSFSLPGQVPSLLLARAWDPELDQTVSGDADRVRGFLQKIAQALPDEQLAEAYAEVRSISLEAWVAAIWQWSQQPDRTADELRQALSRLDGATRSAAAGMPWAEEWLLRMLFAPQRGEHAEYPAGLLPPGVPATWWQALLACRQQGQAAAALADPRAALFLQPAYAGPDEAQRRGLDLLFCGDGQAVAACQAAARGYAEARQRAEQLEQAWLACDWATADLPWYGQASLQEPEAAASAETEAGLAAGWETWNAFRASAGRVADLARQERTLLRQLDEAAARSLAGEAWNEEEPPWNNLLSRSQQLQRRLTELRARYDAWLGELEEWSAHALARRAWGEVLSLPLALQGRGAWRARYQKALEREPEFQVRPRRRQAEQQDQRQPASRRPTPEAPLMALLGLEPTGGAQTQMYQNAARIRSELRQRWRQAWPSASQSSEAVPLPQDAAEARRAIADAARPVREAAVLWGVAPAAAEDPIARLFQFDWHLVLLWHGRRALEDFWLVRDAASSGPAFQRLARRFIDAADNILGSSGDASRALRERLRQAERAAQDLARLDLPSEVLVDNEQKTFELDVSVSLAQDLPSPGQAAIFALAILNAAPSPDTPLAARASLSIPLAQSPQVKKLQAEARPAQWVTALVYRGYVKEAPFTVRGPGTALEVVYRPAPVLPAAVYVEGEAARDPIIVFIFDYSASMNEPAPGNKKRIDYARQAMLDVLGDLAQPGRYDVGLWLYGHRVGKRTGTGERHWRVPAEVQASLERQGIWPNNDVEEVIAPRRLNAQSYGAFEAALSPQLGWGVTPLYQAMTQAMEKGFPSPEEVGNRPRWLVVVTDGVNEVDQLQGQPPLPRAYSLADVEAALVRDAQRYQEPLRLCMVFCAPPPSEPEKAAQYAQLKRLADSAERGRQFVERPEADQIINALRDSLGLREFVLLEESATVGQRERGRAPLGTAVRVPPPFASDMRFRVELASLPQVAPAPLILLGGEAIRLYAERRGTSWMLRHRRYPTAGEDVVLLPAEREHVSNPWAHPQEPLQPAAFYVAVHDVKREGRGRRFRVSVQNDDGSRFSPRPAQMLALLHPSPLDRRTDALGTFFFCDLDVEPGQPVPILSFHAANWPAGVRRAVLDLWFRMAQAQPTRELSVGELERDGCELAGEAGQKLLYNVQIAAEPAGGFAVVLLEKQPQAADGDWYPVLVEFAAGDLSPPTAIVRRYFPESRSAQHRFVFPDVATPDELRPRRIRLTTLADFRRGTGGKPAVEVKNLQFEWNE